VEPEPSSADPGILNADPSYSRALAEVRSCLAALAIGRAGLTQASYFERLLMSLDQLHPDGWATYPLDGDDAALSRPLELAVDRMVALGGDALSLELLFADVVGSITDS
jgi:hypothetical protein